jgi:hypothetical protein
MWGRRRSTGGSLVASASVAADAPFHGAANAYRRWFAPVCMQPFCNRSATPHPDDLPADNSRAPPRNATRKENL